MVAALILTGCTTGNTMKYGNEIADENVAKIVKNKTTVEEVITMFGPPASRSTSGDGDERLTFSGSSTAYNMKMGIFSPWVGPSTQHSNSFKNLLVTTHNGVVTDYTYNSTSR